MSKHRTGKTMWNRLLSGALCLALVLGLLPAGLVQPAQAAGWADPYGQQLVEWGVMRGDISGNLNLNNPITRAEFVTMCNRAFGYTKLGTMPFTDVSSKDWYAEDINIAYNAGYFKGTSTSLASPNAKLTREQAAVLLARNLMLQETSGESLGFSDSRTLNEWSRGLIAAAVAEGMLTGYADGSFRPFNNITRGEVAAMLVRVVGTPVSEEGGRSMGDVYGNVTISASNVTLRNTTIAGNLYITGGVDLGNVLLENVTVLGRVVIAGGGESDASRDSIVLRNVVADELVVDSMIDQFVTVRVQGVTDIPLTRVRSSAYINDTSWSGYGLERIEQDGAPLLQLAGSIKEVVNLTPSSDLQLVQGSAEKVTVDEYATNSQLQLTAGTRVDELNLDAAALVTGEGDIKKLSSGVSGSEIEMLPDTVELRPGTTATINGEKMDSVAAAELSSEPRLMAGYPLMTGIAPTEAELQLSGNKPGTIYWAVSSLADGSVTEADLITNPAYGGNIYQEQAGARTAGAKLVYSEKVEKLTADGSYYVSAILVDGRGKRSPVKVAAFTTPDDTVPAFVGTPEITKATTTVAQVTATANKNCLLYWALLPAGAAAPTAQQFKTGSVGSNYGYGSVNMVKNAPVSITVNSRRLMEKTEYVLYLWLTDHNGAQSMATPVRLTVSTPDETPPVVTLPTQVAPYKKDTADVTFSINEAPATLYWAVVAEGNTTFIPRDEDPEKMADILSDLRNKIKVESGKDAGAISSGASAAAEAYRDVKFTISGLDPAQYGNNFTLYYIGKDAAGNYSERIGSISIQTLDTTPPTVSDPPVFTSYNGDKTTEPLADTGVKLVFSEQVKGGANAAETFLELYNKSVSSSLDEDAKRAAKEKLAKELSDHIQLYHVPRTGSAEVINDTNVIDFRYAIVTQESDGSVVVFLPGEADVGQNGVTQKAINLDSGATYYFQLLGVFDTAFVPNGVSNTGQENPSGNLKLSDFKTVYAQVNLEWNTRVSSIKDASDSTLNDIRLDIVVDVKPTSTEKVPDTEYWDMIMWSDKRVEIKIYRLVLDKEGNVYEDWNLLNSTAVPITVTQIDPVPGIGLGSRVLSGDMDEKYPVIKTSLTEGYTYRYGIHITKVGSVTETKPKEEADSWSDLVTMHFGLIAGAQGQVRNASINVKDNFDNNFAIRQGNVSYISTARTESGSSEVLEASKQFLDTQVPSFSNQWPKFTAGSSVINMKVALDRPGTVYYVAAPAGTIPLSIPASNGGNPTIITPDNDGSDGNTPAGFTYIPTSGADRDIHKTNIYFKTGDNGDRGVYGTPDYTDVMGGNFPRDEGTYIPEQPITYTNAEVSVDMTGLKPETEYYIYCVLQGGGTADRVVEVYRVKTEKVQVPSVTATGTGTTVTMSPSEDSELYFALVDLNSLPNLIMQNLEAMRTRASGTSGKSVFDVDALEETKKAVAEYILGNPSGTGSIPTQTWKLPDGLDYKDPIKANQQVRWDFERYMTSGDNDGEEREYVVLVMARHQYGGTNGADYGFAAVRALFLPDKVPPEFKPSNIKNPNLLQPEITMDGGTGMLPTTPEDAISHSYSGTVYVEFTKNLYFHDTTTNKLYSVVPKKPTPTADLTQDEIDNTYKTYGELIYGNAVDNGRVEVISNGTTVTQGITLKLTGIRHGETISFFKGGRIANRSDFSTSKTLTLRFNTLLKSGDYDGVEINMYYPGFEVTWG